MAKRAFIKFEIVDIDNGLLDFNGFNELFTYLPNDTKLVSAVNYSNEMFLYFESSNFIDISAQYALPEIIVSLLPITSDPNGRKYIDSVDTSLALPAYSQQGNQTQSAPCSIQGCHPNSPCSFCYANSPVTFPTIATPSPWSQNPVVYSPSVAGTYRISSPSYSGTVKIDLGCSHKWKSYQGLNEQFDFCETCNEKRK